MAYRKHNEEIMKDLEYGDLIGMESNCVLVHVAVYIGDGEIAHYVGRGGVEEAVLNVLSSSSSQATMDGFYVRGKIDHNRKIYKYNYYDDSIKPLPKEQIKENVMSKLGRGDKYNLATNNCQHFANWCRYGKRMSQQSEQAGTLFASSVGAAAVIICAVCAPAKMLN